MFLEETVQYCSTCEEITPHSRRRIALPRVVAGVALAGVGWSVWLGGAWFGLALVLVAGSGLLLLSDRERFWRTRCDRCRRKKRAVVRATKPKPGADIIDIW